MLLGEQSRHGPTHRLGPRYPLGRTQGGKGFHLLIREIDDGAHDAVIIYRIGQIGTITRFNRLNIAVAAAISLGPTGKQPREQGMVAVGRVLAINADVST
jgi:hypothetical protein